MIQRNSVLSQVADSIDNFIKSLKPLIQFDISVADDYYLRIAATGQYQNYTGLSLPPTSGHAFVLRSGKPLTILKPLQEDVCLSCSIRNICSKDISIIYPIYDANKIIGAVTIGTADENKKSEFIASKDYLMNFLKEIANLISLKVREKKSQDFMKIAFSEINEGIIITDKNGFIIQINKYLEEKEFSQGDWIQKFLPQSIIHDIYKTGLNTVISECYIDFGKDEVLFKLTARRVINDEENSNIIFILKEINESDATRESALKSIHLNNIKGKSQKMVETKTLAMNAAKGESNILIQGESGTGKEVIARAVHQMSSRADQPFIAINCAAIPENLLESELFGYEEGAFTGAKKGGKIGKFELAGEGTIFLDEIGDLSLHLQPKILRVIEYGLFERVGGIKSKKMKARIIAATNQNLEHMIVEKKFREDLYYRLNVINIPIYPLRSRREDILELAHWFINKYTRKLGNKVGGFSEEAEKLLLLYKWPGNVRELENAIEYALNFESSQMINAASLPKKIQEESLNTSKVIYDYNLRDVEINSIKNLIEIHGDSYEGKVKIAEKLGISMSTLYRRLKNI